MATDLPPTVRFDLRAELDRLDRERLERDASAESPMTGLWVPILCSTVAGAGCFAAGMAFEHFVLR